MISVKIRSKHLKWISSEVKVKIKSIDMKERSTDRRQFIKTTAALTVPDSVALEYKLWPMWNFRGGFGILDSERPDVSYEDFRSHKLDRKMLEVIKEV